MEENQKIKDLVEEAAKIVENNCPKYPTCEVCLNSAEKIRKLLKDFE